MTSGLLAAFLPAAAPDFQTRVLHPRVPLWLRPEEEKQRAGAS